MRADGFYQTVKESALPLEIITQAHYLKGLDLSTAEGNCLRGQQFTGCLGNIGLIYANDGNLSKVYIGAGEATDVQAITFAANCLPVGHYYSPKALSLRARVAWSLAQYSFDHYKQPASGPRTLHVSEQELPSILAEASAVFLVRDLINMPTNDLGPEELANVVSTLANQFGAEFKQWVGKELVEANYPAIYTVGRSASNAPRLLSLSWGDSNHPRVTLVGKGVCFDTGGLDIKPANGMRIMKKDMGGAAHVIGLAQWLMSAKLPIRLHVLIPAVENGIGPDAYRPGDVINMRNGLKVEIDNTDAEGRLVLADALVKACEEKPELIIDFSTLTGAARVAVGTEIAAMFSNDDSLAQAITQASQDVGDPVWRMPLFSGYVCMLDSSIADLANSSASPYAGAITAALFLQCFIDGGVSWAHFDIMAWNLCTRPGKTEGGEAMGMQAVAQYLFNRYAR